MGISSRWIILVVWRGRSRVWQRVLFDSTSYDVWLISDSTHCPFERFMHSCSVLCVLDCLTVSFLFLQSHDPVTTVCPLEASLVLIRVMVCFPL